MFTERNRQINRIIISAAMAIIMAAGIPLVSFAQETPASPGGTTVSSHDGASISTPGGTPGSEAEVITNDITPRETDKTAENDQAENKVSVDLSDMSPDTAVSGELLVLVEEKATQREIEHMVEDTGSSVKNTTTLENGTTMVKVGVDEGDDIQTVADELALEEEVLIVQPNYLYKLEASGSSREGEQWYTKSDGSALAGSTRAESGWAALPAEGDKVRVAVIDTGVKLDHPDLQDNIAIDDCVTFNGGKQLGFSDRDSSDDDDGHGTHVCGIIAARAQDNYGITGLSYNRAELIVIDATLPKSAEFATDDVVCSINYAVEKGAKIINMSLGALHHDYFLDETINDTARRHPDVLIVCAAGNENSELPECPGDSAGALSVMAHNQSAVKTSFSNYGYEKDISAPGEGIISTINDSSLYSTKNGTSMAAPMISGIAAMLKSQDPDLTARQLKNLIYTSSDTKGFSKTSGFGQVNAEKAIRNNSISIVNGPYEPTEIVLNRTEKAMYPEESFNIEYAVYPAGASRYSQDVSYSSSDPSVATVDASGKVTAVSPGSASIEVRCHEAVTACMIQVKDIPYVDIPALPYVNKGKFSPTDPELPITYNIPGTKRTMSWLGMTDGYRLYLEEGSNPVKVEVSCGKALPYIRIYDPAGKDVSNNRSLSGSEDNPPIYTSVSFEPKKTGTYRIQVSGESFGSTTVDKEYSLYISRMGIQEFRLQSQTAVRNVVDKTYTGSSITQRPVVTYGNYTMIQGKDYTLSYKNNKKVGKATMTITGKGNYMGSATVSFKILPKGTSVKKLRKKGRTLTVKWKKQSRKMSTSRITGYQVQVASDVRFKKNVKTVTKKGYKKTSHKFKKLKGKKHYVRVRTYKKTGGKKYVSKWSSIWIIQKR